MTRCHRIDITKNDLKNLLSHIAVQKCTECSQELVDYLPNMHLVLTTMLTEIDQKRSEREFEKKKHSNGGF